MRMLQHVFDRQSRRRIDPEAYLDLTEDDSTQQSVDKQGKTRIRLADIETQRDLLEAKDALYDGDIVLVYTDRLGRSELTEELVIDELLSVTQEINGDIVKKVNGQIIAAPGTAWIDREKIGQ